METTPSNGARARVRLVFADEGLFHEVTAMIPAARIDDFDRLIDVLREDPEVTRRLYVDLRRLVSASLVEEDGVE